MVGWNNMVMPKLALSARSRAFTGGVLAVGLTVASGYRSPELGLSTSDLRRGSKIGVAASTLPAAGLLIAGAIPGIRSRFRRAEPREEFLEWVSVHIPVGTVLAEELMFRSVLSAVLRRAWPRSTALGIHAAAFGLWHVSPARSSGDSVLATVVFTGAAALVFEELRRRSGSVMAPAILHLTVNVGGAFLSR